MGRAIVIDYGHKFAAQAEVSLILTETKLICQLICQANCFEDRFDSWSATVVKCPCLS